MIHIKKTFDGKLLSRKVPVLKGDNPRNKDQSHMKTYFK